MVETKKRKLMALVSGILCCLFLSSCIHVVVHEITVKSKFAKKYDCPRKKIKVIEDDTGNRGDTRKLVGCGVTAVYKGSEEIYSQK